MKPKAIKEMITSSRAEKVATQPLKPQYPRIDYWSMNEEREQQKGAEWGDDYRFPDK